MKIVNKNFETESLKIFYDKIEQSERDILEKRVHTLGEVKQQIKEWRAKRKL